MGTRFGWIATVILLAGQIASASALLQTIGNTNSADGLAGGFTDGSQVTSGTIAAADSGNPAPFSGITCGADPFSNCSTSWTFSSFGTLPAGQMITSATITLGIDDLDPHAAGNQVASYMVAGADLTSALNTAAEMGSTDCVGAVANKCFDNIYQIVTVTIPSSAYAQLATGSAAVSFSTQAPGWGLLGPTAFNGVFLDFATLDITTSGLTSSTPEPGTWLSLSLGLLGLAGFACRRTSSFRK